jgi:hypothetical protein
MSASGSGSASGSQVTSAPAPSNTNPSTLSPVAGTESESRQKYLAQREQDLRAKYAEITAYDSHPQVSVYNARDIGILKDKYADLEAYFNTHRTMLEEKLDVQLVKRLAVINDILAALGPRTVVGWMSATFQAQVEAKAVGGHTLIASEERTLRGYAKEVRAFYLTNPEGAKGAYMKAAVKYLTQYKALGPEFAAQAEAVLQWAIAIDVKHAMAAAAGGADGGAVEQKLSQWEDLLYFFLKTLAVTVVAGLFVSCGMWAANDAIWRPAPYRVLFFFYGMAGFLVTLPYYLYRYFTNPVKRFAILPLIRLPPDYEYSGFFDKLSKLFIHYKPDTGLEDIWKSYWRYEQGCAAGMSPADVQAETQP